MDEYKMLGKSIAELNDIAEDDPWQTIIKDNQPTASTETNPKQCEPEPPLEQIFELIDPEDDEDLRVIGKSSMTLFWRMVIPNRRLIEIITLEPSILKVGLVARNNQTGCWIAFTSRRVAERLSRSLMSQQVVNDLHVCDIDGNQVTINMPYVNEVKVTEWRPWNTSGTPGSMDDMKAEEFFYCLIDEGDTLRACFVPESHWNAHHELFNGDLEIDRMLGSGFAPAPGRPYCYESRRESLMAKSFLDQAGFRDNLIFRAFINENLL